jgi:hypothetical protein
MIRTCCGLLLLSLILSGFSGCGGPTDPSKANMQGESPPEAKSPKKFTPPSE